MPSILVTDSQFIFPEHEERIRTAGYDIERLNVLKASEAQLIEAIKGKVGYILGGIETVTDTVIAAADQLQVIAFTGSGYQDYIPAWNQATNRGIAISTAKGANARAVAEFTIALALAQIREIPSLTSAGGSDYFIAREFSSLTFGILGWGSVGRQTAKIATVLGFRVITSGDPDSDSNIAKVPLEELVATSDVISIHVSRIHGVEVLSADLIASLKHGAVLINVAFPEAINNDALVERLKRGDVRAATDYPLVSWNRPIGALLSTNAQTAFNTDEANHRTSDRVTASLLNLLAGKQDEDLVNPQFSDFR